MTDERDDLLGIFDKIINIDGMWKELKFVRRKLPEKTRLTIVATDQYDNDYTYQEDF